MAVTVKGFQSTISDVDMSTQFPHHAPSVYGIGDLAVSAVNGARTVSVAAGTAVAGFVKYLSDAAQTLALAPPSSGGKWYAITLDRQWSPTSTVTLKADDLAATDANGTIPAQPSVAAMTAAASLPNQPGTAGSTAGQRQVLALVYVRAADTTLTIFDMRLRRTGSGVAAAATLWALTYAGQASHFLDGALVAVGRHVMPSGAIHERSVWQKRTNGSWIATGQIVTDDGPVYTNLNGALSGNNLSADTGNSRADLIAIAAFGWVAPIGLNPQTELLELLTGSTFRFASPTAGNVAWRLWDSPWFDYSFVDIENIGGTVTLSKIRMAAGIAQLEWTMQPITAQGGSRFKLGYFPGPFRRPFTSSSIPKGTGIMLYANGQKVRVFADWNSPNPGENVMTFSYVGTDGLEHDFTGTTPQNTQGGNIFLSMEWPAYSA